MFTFNAKKKTLKEIDDQIEELKKDRDEAFLELEGYAKAKEVYLTKSAICRIDGIDASIHQLNLLRISVEYM